MTINISYTAKIVDEGVKVEVGPKRAAPKVLDSRTFNDGKIYLYRRADYKKPIWFIRLRIPGAKGYVWKSSGNTDEHAAYAVADKLYNQALVKVFAGSTHHSKKISDGLAAYIKHHERNRERRSIHYKILLANRLIPIFKGRVFDDLDTALISRMVDELVATSKRGELSPNTIKRSLTDLRHILNWCTENGYLGEIPRFPTVMAAQTRRPHFDTRDWTRLTGFMRSWVKGIKHPSILRDRTLLVNYVLVLANTGIRVGEARTLKWRDIRPIESRNNADTTNVSLSVKGKTGMRVVVARTPDVKRYLGRILALRRSDLLSKRSDIYDRKEVPLDSFVFCDTNGKPIGSFKKSFHTLIKDAGIMTDSYGQRRSLYSLRHTYATFRLQEGVDSYILAQNMGTSVAMLERFYGHTSTLASTAELTKTRGMTRSYKASKSASSLDWLTVIEDRDRRGAQPSAR